MRPVSEQLEFQDRGRAATSLKFPVTSVPTHKLAVTSENLQCNSVANARRGSTRRTDICHKRRKEPMRRRMKSKEVITLTKLKEVDRLRGGAERGGGHAGTRQESGSLTSAQRCGTAYQCLFTVSPAEPPPHTHTQHYPQPPPQLTPSNLPQQ